MGATTDGYDGIPYDALPIEAVEVRLDQEQHLARRQRTGASHEVDIEPSWAVEAALVPAAAPPDGSWLVVTTWLAGRQQRRIYWEEPDE